VGDEHRAKDVAQSVFIDLARKAGAVAADAETFRVVRLEHGRARYGEGGGVPKALTDYIKGREGYDYAHHGKAGNPSTDFVPDDIVDRFCLVGPESAHLDRLAELKELGVDQFSLYLMHDDRDKTLAAYGTSIIPAL